jgi:GH15 family glucan-1,4-alpha-glucosidase
MKIEDYGFISDLQTCALVGRDGSIDWLCLPRFDSAACFAALLGSPENGRWQIAPVDEPVKVTRRYRGDSLILETIFETETGVVRLIDFMPPRVEHPEVVRIVEGVRGRVNMQLRLTLRFDYGQAVPWVRQRDGDLHAIVGPDEVIVRTPVKLVGEDHSTCARFTVRTGQEVPFVLTWYPSHLFAPKPVSARRALQATGKFWKSWAARFTDKGEWSEAVLRSLVTLKGLIYAPTGGIVAAATTSLPEKIGGERNWDYRFCWLRDASFTLHALLTCGYFDEAMAWRDWLLRAVAGSAEQLQIMYGLAGERRIDEWELPWLPGYEGSRPVRVGNAAVEQFQLDVFGTVIATLHGADCAGLPPQPLAAQLRNELMRTLERHWHLPDEGIWEVRGKPRHFVHSKVMAWLAADRAVKMSHHQRDRKGIRHWTTLRNTIHREVCENGFNQKIGAFVQSYGAKELDASVLQMPMVGFLPYSDPRVQGTVRAIEERLVDHGLVRRYETASNVDGLESREGAFLLCSFWLAICRHHLGRVNEARALFENVLSMRNDLGLLAEEYDPLEQRQLGNFPQAFSHVGLVIAAQNLRQPPAINLERK